MEKSNSFKYQTGEADWQHPWTGDFGFAASDRRSGKRQMKRLLIMIWLNVVYSTAELGIGLFTGACWNYARISLGKSSIAAVVYRKAEDMNYQSVACMSLLIPFVGLTMLKSYVWG
ncbi:hypothetical protein GH714_036735 [Hevea brasiliensis]|uniref:Uncharacterized protein n=1 Tax=Hevea brasiliensis TaxID=3981 RepID=A0A6A6KPZ2_HEVBR|nr:hypothetical protein GH714_036735 [Hevea brasiliensis]